MKPIKKPLALRSLRLSQEDWDTAEAIALLLGGKGHSAGVRAAMELAVEFFSAGSGEDDGPYGEAKCHSRNRPAHTFHWNLQGEPEPGQWVTCEATFPSGAMCCHTFIWHAFNVFEAHLKSIEAHRKVSER